MKNIDSKSGAVYRELREIILSGRYTTAESFPSETILSRRYGVSRSLIKIVMGELEHNGLIRRVQGRGTFVTKGAVARKIGLIVPGVACSDFFQPIISEINRLAHEAGYSLRFAEIYSTSHKERIRQVRELAAEFVSRRCAGVIYEPMSGADGKLVNDCILSHFNRKKIPVVLVDCDVVPFPQHSGYDVVGVNDVEAGARLAEHLLSVGARNIHFLVGSLFPTTFENRLWGALAALRHAGIPKSRCEILRAEADDSAALRRHLKRGRPDAFICWNDTIAAKFCQTLAAVGLRVPDDILLTGFADLPVARLMTPQLTTIRQSREGLGRIAFERLLARIADPTLPVQDIYMPAPLVARASTKRG